MTNTEYNGWTNYATWRVNLELINMDHYIDTYEDSNIDTYDLSKVLEEDIKEYVSSTARDTIAEDYALAFLNDVNWYEIAKHITDEFEREIA